MVDILVHPVELRQTASQLRDSAKKIGQALQTIDSDIQSLKGDKFLGNRANVVQSHYQAKRDALQKAANLVTLFAKDLETAANVFEQADKGGSQPLTPGAPSQAPIRPEIPSAPPSSPPSPSNKMPKISDIALNQWDSRWANVKMNDKTGETLGNYGCLETVVAMIARANGKDVTPADVDKWIDTNGGYSDEGSYMPANTWTGFLNNVLGKNGSINTIDTTNIRQNIDSGTPVVLHINSSINPTDGHYVLAVGVDSNGNYICADPNGGKESVVLVSDVWGARVYK